MKRCATTRTRSVYIAYTGGTIGMAREPGGGFRPRRGFLQEQMRKLSILEHPDMPHYDLHEYDPILDSSNMTPSDWLHMAKDLYAKYDDYDGFIVLHGTDTMSYSASALSFLFENLGKTILFTGSQIPLCEARTDGYENLVRSLLIAAESRIPEVCVLIGTSLLRGNRSTKVNADRFSAFDAPNYPPLARTGVEIEYHPSEMLPQPQGALRFHPILSGRDAPKVVDIRLFPGISAEILERLLDGPFDGVVLHTYGAGNAPDDPEFLRVLRDVCDRGVIVVNCTQCLAGTVRMDTYATGNSLATAGVISGVDMTPEAALTKLYCLLSRDRNIENVKRLMQENLRGEMTVEDP